MALDLSDIDTWDTGALEEFARQLARRSQSLDQLGTDLADASRLPGWHGLGAAAAAEQFDRVLVVVSHQCATAGAVTELATSLVDQVKTLQRELDAARDEAGRNGLQITPAGTVDDHPGVVIGALGGSGIADRAAREVVRETLERRIRALLDVATDVEADTTAILTRAAEGGFDGNGMTAEDARKKGRYEADAMFQAPPPPDDVDGQQHYLDALSPDQLDEIMREHPEWLANAYGIDPAIRARATEAYLPLLRGEILAERAPLVRELQELRDTPPAGPGGPAVRDSKIRDLQAQLEPLDNALADLDRIDDVTGADPRTHLLGLRQHDSGVGAVVARGDITAADHVTVNVPGTSTTARDGLQGQLSTLDALELEMEERLEADGRGHQSIATVTYMNMDFPPTIPEARHAHYADTAAPDLAGVLDGIATTSADGTNLTLLGHSYGSVTASEALQAGGEVDNVVFYGSPGLETSGDPFDADSLGVDPENRYVMYAAREPIQYAHLLDPFGGTPHTDPDLTRLGTSAHDDLGLVASSGHSEYQLPDSTSLHNLAAVSTDAHHATIAYDAEKFEADHYHRVLGQTIPRLARF